MATYGGYTLEGCYKQEFALTLCYMDYIIEDKKRKNEN